MISRSVPHTPSAIASTSSAPSEAGGSGRSHNSTEFGLGGRTVMARKGKALGNQPPRRFDAHAAKKFPQSVEHSKPTGPAFGRPDDKLRALRRLSAQCAPLRVANCALRVPQHQIVPVHHFGAALDAENEQHVS